MVMTLLQVSRLTQRRLVTSDKKRKPGNNSGLCLLDISVEFIRSGSLLLQVLR